MSAVANLLTVAAVALAYWLGRQHEARADERAWVEYAAWMQERRNNLTQRFRDIRT